MNIFLNNLRRLSRQKSNYISLILLPLAFMFLSMNVFVSSRPVIKVGIYDEDKTAYTEFLKSSAGKNATIIELSDANMKRALLNSNVDYGIVIEKGFTESILKNGIPSGVTANATVDNVSSVKTYKVKETDQTSPFEYYLSGILNSTRNIAAYSDGDITKFMKGISYFNEQQTTVTYKDIAGTDNRKDKARVAFGFMIMFLMFFASNASSLLLEDKELRTYDRVLTSPVSLRKFYFTNIASYFAVISIQILLIIFAMKLIFNAYLGTSALIMFAFLLVVGFMSVSLGVAISAFCKNSKQANGLSTLIIVPLCMLGGCFWPVEIMPKFFREIALFNPVKWSLSGIDTLIYQNQTTSLAATTGIILLFSLAFLLLGSNRRIAWMAKK